MDLCDPRPLTLASFCAKIAERAAIDHAHGVKRRPTGRELCQEYAEGYRKLHLRLATTIYNSTRLSYELAEREQEEAAQ